MDPISSAVAGYAADKLTNVVEGAVRKHVIERWTRYRAKKFFEAFCESLLDAGVTDADIGATLDLLLADESKSEIMFEAYRAVCLSRSKDLGPRVIAMITAELVLVKATSTCSDDLIFSAAEELLDSELSDFSDFAISFEKKLNNGDKDIRLIMDGSIEILIKKETIDLNWTQGSTVSVGPMDLAEEVGYWAPKLKQIGLISDDVREKQYRYEEDSERYIDMPGVAREIRWWLTLTKSSLVLAKLVRRARAGRGA